MKKNIFILILSLVLTATCYSQTKDSVLIADETTLILNGSKTEAKIVCYNESVFRDLHKSHLHLFKRYTYSKKKDRHGEYLMYVIYLAKGDAEIITKYAKHNL